MCVYGCMCVCVYVCLCLSLCVCVYARICVYMCVCASVCVYVCYVLMRVCVYVCADYPSPFGYEHFRIINIGMFGGVGARHFVRSQHELRRACQADGNDDSIYSI